MQVVAIDGDHRAIARGKARGRTVVRAKWPHFAAGAYDAVLFSRSLHHMADLDAAVARALAVLHPRGVVLVEDFAVEAIDNSCLTWLAGVVAGLAAAGRAPTRRGFLDRLASASDPMDSWAKEHAGVHAATAVAAALLANARVRRSTTAPYLFRYFDGYDPATQRAVLAAENKMIRRGLLPAVGRRFVVGRGPDRGFPNRPGSGEPGQPTPGSGVTAAPAHRSSQ